MEQTEAAKLILRALRESRSNQSPTDQNITSGIPELPDLYAQSGQPPYHGSVIGEPGKDLMEFLKNELLRQQLTENLTLDLRKRSLRYQPNEDFSATLDPSKIEMRGKIGSMNLDGAYRPDGTYDMGLSNPFLGGNLHLRYSQRPEDRNLRLQYQRNF